MGEMNKRELAKRWVWVTVTSIDALEERSILDTVERKPGREAERMRISTYFNMYRNGNHRASG